MKKLFYAGIALLVLFELANVWFIMPLPFSQRVRSIDIAYFLYGWRWLFRGVAAALIAVGLRGAWRVPGWRKIGVVASVLLAAVVTYMTNFVMSADKMFLAPASLVMRPAAQNTVDAKRLVVGVEIDGEARAYPVQFIGYHHQVRDTVAGIPVMVSFCTVCRTGRVFSPNVDGKTQTFRLVGMDHWNAMFEDSETKSWWRQANGEAIAGPKKGAALAEIPSRQVTLAQWLALHPGSLIMQPDAALQSKYSNSFDFETGASRSTLTGTDTASWHDKSWVVGITHHRESRAYDWNRLLRERVINDQLGRAPIVLALASDGASFFAFVRPDSATAFAIRNDSLVAGDQAYALTGKGVSGALVPLDASQEFWHSWRTFQPATSRY
ncbi:MAG: DUF3179 domain-containing (seleno)protein [Gemmatimonadota bacterium]